jgi:gentisate 1,2-dioxygenase
MFFEPYPSGGLEPIATRGPSPMRIPSDEALGPGREAKTIEVGAGVMPTIAMHLMRQPAGGRIDVGKTTTNHLYAVSRGQARFTVEGGTDDVLGVGDLIAVPCWHTHAIEAVEDAVIFRVSDEPLLKKLGLARNGAG